MANITYNELVNSSDYARIQAYSEHLNVPEDAYSKGCYYENSHWYKDFYVYANGVTLTVKVLMQIETASPSGYTLKARAVMCQNESSDTVQTIARAFSIGIDNQNIDDTVTELKRYIQDKLNDEDTDTINLLKYIRDEKGDYFSVDYFGETPVEQIDIFIDQLNDLSNIKKYDSSIINYLYDFFLHEYGDIGNYYKYKSIERENGVYHLESWDNESPITALSGEIKDGSITIGSYNSDDIYEIMTDIYTLDDADISIIKSMPVVRVAFRQITPTNHHISISGFEIENNNLSISNNGANMGAIVTKAKSVTFNLVNGVLTKDSTFYDETPITCVFTNTTRGVSIDRYGRDGGTVAKTNYDICIDSIGYSGKIAEYTILAPDYPTPNTTPSTKYPTWIPTPVDPVPVGDIPTDDPTPPTPTVIRHGTPDPFKIITPTPTPTPVPVPTDVISNVETSENDPPTTQGSLGYMYDLGVGFTENDPLYQLGDFLYNPTNVERICQIWKNDPTQSIISLHYLYIDPDTTSSKVIMLGNVNTNINANPITNRYKTFNCGTRTIERKFNNFMDYQTHISLYLPFSGFQTLNTNDVMNSKVTVKGTVDVCTGDILYQIIVNRKKPDGTFMTDNKCLYTFTGNCKVDIPYSSSSISSGLASGIGGVISSLVSKNPISAITSATSTAMGGISSVSHGGSLSGNTGAMGYKYPYFIIEYPKVNDISLRGKLFGYTSNKTVTLSQVSGYAEFERIHIDKLSCSDEDRQEIESICKSGIIL